MRLLALCALGSSLAATAQPFPIGSRPITYYDAANDRNIATNLYYPGVSAGSNVAVADGVFPVIVIGHGFVMNTDAYANLWNHFVPKGYIVALPTTEGGFVPNHGNFGQDIAYIAEALQTANSDAGSPFYGHVLPATALMGHSMGGGASLLGAAMNTTIQTVVVFAPAETNPSAVAAATDVLVPTLVFAGTNDCVTPIADHAGPIYDALTMPCRAFVNINGGGHCYFAESNFNCNFGELTCSPPPAITRAQQHDVVNDMAGLWLDHFLLNDQAALGSFLDSALVTTRAECATTCTAPTSVADRFVQTWSLFPVPAVDLLRMEGVGLGATLRVVDVAGREVLPELIMASNEVIDVSSLLPGAYRALVATNTGIDTRWFVVMR